MKLRLNILGILFVVGGVLGGWWFLADNAVSDAHAQVQGQCAPGRNCTANTYKATVPSGSTALGMNRGSYLNFNQDQAGSVHIRASGAQLELTGSAGIQFFGNATTAITSAMASGSNGFALNTNGARVDFGTGSSDYCASDGTSVLCNGSNTGVIMWRGQSDGVDVASIAANTCNDAATTVTIAGANFTTGSVCTVGTAVNGTGIKADVVPYAWPSDTTVVTIRLCCNDGANACDPVSQNYYVTCFQ